MTDDTTAPSGWLCGGGLTRYADSESSILRGLYVFSHPLIVACLILYWGLLHAAPEALGGSDGFTSVLRSVGSLVPWPAAFAQVSSFPEQTEAFFSAWLICCPLMTLVMTPRIVRAERRGWYRRWRLMSLQKQFLLAVGNAVILVAFIAGMLIAGDPSFCRGCTTSNRMGLLLIYGLGMPGGLSLELGGIPTLFLFFFKSFSKTYFSGRHHE